MSIMTGCMVFMAFLSLADRRWILGQAFCFLFFRVTSGLGHFCLKQLVGSGLQLVHSFLD